MPTSQPTTHPFLDASNANTDQLVFYGVFLAVLAVCAVITNMALRASPKDASKIYAHLLRRAVPLLTVCFLVLAVVLLAESGKLTDGAVSILSGIAGYVLGSVQKDTTKQKVTPVGPTE